MIYQRAFPEDKITVVFHNSLLLRVTRCLEIFFSVHVNEFFLPTFQWCIKVISNNVEINVLDLHQSCMLNSFFIFLAKVFLNENIIHVATKFAFWNSCIQTVYQGAHRESRMKFPEFSPMKKYIVLHLRGRSYPEKHLKMGPLRVILRDFKAIQSYIYKVISNEKFLRKNIQSSMICMQLKMYKVCNRSLLYQWFTRDRQHFQ